MAPRRDLSRSIEYLRQINRWVGASQVQYRIEQITTGQHLEIVGVVRKIVIDPSQVPALVLVTVSDGTGGVVVAWRRPSLPSGLEPGAGILLRGEAELGPTGEIFFHQPDFEIVAGPLRMCESEYHG